MGRNNYSQAIKNREVSVNNSAQKGTDPNIEEGGDPKLELSKDQRKLSSRVLTDYCNSAFSSFLEASRVLFISLHHSEK